MDPRTTAHEAAAEKFARELGTFLAHHSSNGDAATMSLVAPPHFLGLLRSTLSKETDHLVRSSLAEDLVRVPADQLRPRMEPLLVPGLFQ
jgi:protein required for attachment to host cells